jgi:hypothetical protein
MKATAKTSLTSAARLVVAGKEQPRLGNAKRGLAHNLLTRRTVGKTSLLWFTLFVHERLHFVHG